MATRKQTSSPEQVVAYIGTSHVREIDAEAWGNVGAEGQDVVSWHEGNDWEVPVSALSEQALAYLATEDEEFEVREVVYEAADEAE